LAFRRSPFQLRADGFIQHGALCPAGSMIVQSVPIVFASASANGPLTPILQRRDCQCCDMGLQTS
jgi:hypothetical protein